MASSSLLFPGLSTQRWLKKTAWGSRGGRCLLELPSLPACSPALLALEVPEHRLHHNPLAPQTTLDRDPGGRAGWGLPLSQEPTSASGEGPLWPVTCYVLHPTPNRAPAPSAHPLCPQLLSESQGHMAHLVNSVGDVLDALQRDRGLGRPRAKADLQRAPARGARPRGCATGEWGRGCFPPVTWVPAVESGEAGVRVPSHETSRARPCFHVACT